jgi:hypothetical protein
MGASTRLRARFRALATAAMILVASFAVVATSYAPPSVDDSVNGPSFTLDPEHRIVVVRFGFSATPGTFRGVRKARLTLHHSEIWSGLDGRAPDLGIHDANAGGETLGPIDATTEECHGRACVGTHELTFEWPPGVDAGSVRVDWSLEAYVEYERDLPDGAAVSVAIASTTDLGSPPRRFYDGSLRLSSERPLATADVRISSDTPIPSATELAVEVDPAALERAGARLMLIQPSGRRSFLSSGVATPLDVPPVCRDRACAFRITLLASLVPHSPMPLGPVTWGLSTTGATTSLSTVFTERSTFRISSTARLPRLRLKGNPKYWLSVTFDVPPAAVPRWAFGELRPLFVAELDVDPDARHAIFTNDLALLRASVSAAGSPPRTGGPFLSWDAAELSETADPVVVPDSCRPGRSCRIDVVLHVRMLHNARGRLDLAPRLTITLGYPLRAPDLHRAGIEIRPGGEWIRGIGPTSDR